MLDTADKQDMLRLDCHPNLERVRRRILVSGMASSKWSLEPSLVDNTKIPASRKLR